MTTSKRQHPSVLFQRGEVKDFHTACDVYKAQYREELLIGREIQRDYPTLDPLIDQRRQRELEEQAEAVMDIELAVEEARAIYRQVVQEAARRAAAMMRDSDNIHRRLLADALESGDYSQLAV